tara:strand:+ start:208 stop:507 length:300 start_codon:yes stop_codon:yes gene_type:complete
MYRASGSPINSEDSKLYHEELNAKMDEIEKTMGKCTAKNASSYQEMMEQIHRKLSSSYPNKKRIQCPESPKELETLCKDYGSVAFCVEDEKLVLYIMDA